MIPFELQNLRQWCVSSADSKIPLTPTTGKRAKVDNPLTWGTYEEAVNSGYPVIGFVLTKNDPYAAIDLDAPINDEQRKRHNKILKKVESYTEFSISGTGLHILVKASIPKGVKKDKVEIYSELRYIITTGNVFKDLPITDQQVTINQLFGQILVARTTAVESRESIVDDQAILDMGMYAVNGEKFNRLCCGNWQQYYRTQSEADHALMSMLCFYSPDNAQVKRMFHMSALGKREKAHRPDYVNRCINSIRRNEPPRVDIEELLKERKAILNTPIDPLNEHTAPDLYSDPILVNDTEIDRDALTEKVHGAKSKIIYPTGFVGEVAGYMYEHAIKPVHEIAVAGAIGLMAGVNGRCYNISNTGLNQYIVLLAKTGVGKGGISSGIDSILFSVRKEVPSVNDFKGPGEFASGQSILKTIAKRTSIISVLGEVGLLFKQLDSKKSNTSQQMIKRVLLDLYSRSGHTDILDAMVYSDKEKNTEPINSPAFSFIGESTPHSFFENIDIDNISEGLIPRLMFIEYKGKRPPTNYNRLFFPPKPLTDSFIKYTINSLRLQQSNKRVIVKLSPEANKIFKDYDKFIDSKINNSNEDIHNEVWNRANLKSLRLAALVATGHSISDPVISQEIANYAIDFINDDISTVLKRFKNDLIGTGDARIEGEIHKIIKAYFQMDTIKRATYGTPKKIIDKAIVPLRYITKRALRLSVFKQHNNGANFALKSGLQSMVDSGVIEKLNANDAFKEFGLKSHLYICGENWSEK